MAPAAAAAQHDAGRGEDGRLRSRRNGGSLALVLLLRMLPSAHSLLSSRTPVLSLSATTSNVPLEPLPPTYFINRDVDADRRTFMERQLHGSAKTVTRVPATNLDKTEACLADRTCLLAEKARVWNGENDNLEMWSRQLRHIYSKSEIACTLSHLDAIRKAFADGVEWALILEDDADLAHRPLWGRGGSIQALAQKAPSDWQVLQLWVNNPEFYRNHSAPNSCISEMNRPLFVPWMDRCWSTMAYLVRRSGMRAILDATTAPSASNATLLPLPVVADHLLFKVAKTYSLTRPAFRHQDASVTLVQQKAEDVEKTDGWTNNFVDEFYKHHGPSMCPR
eukprot:TRINITY_DN31115_c0_g1_i1.p1 TRINITY_DN31115_c0_g1~~TRINITY_DN31115_c0_g1_i1.p1  ORF type:complete len:336 (-),score=66.76 TRINITY_DN31115_c0_g1_i1:124-1131(-)